MLFAKKLDAPYQLYNKIIHENISAGNTSLLPKIAEPERHKRGDNMNLFYTIVGSASAVSVFIWQRKTKA